MVNTLSPRIDPELRDLLPPHAPEELVQLEENCKADPNHELMPPVQVCPKLDGALVDGHNQFEIRSRLDLAIKYAEINRSGREIVSTKFQKEALAVLGKLWRALMKLRLQDEFEGYMDAIKEGIKHCHEH